ncbi:unnamed protein product [Sympodiomycopsis kandeliae]
MADTMATANPTLPLSSILLSSLPQTSSSPGHDLTPSNGQERPQSSWDGVALLQSLQRLGIGHDLKESDLTLPDLQQHASSSSSSQSSALSMLLSRLSLLLSDLSQLQETQIRNHLTTLLDSASRIQSLEGQVRDVRRSVSELETGLEKLSAPTRKSLVRLKRDQKRLKRLHSVQDLLGHANQYVTLARRLEGYLKLVFDEPEGDDSKTIQQQHEQALVDSAQCLESISSSLRLHPSLTSLSFVQSYTPSIQSARGQVVDKMESSIVNGLRDLNPSLLSSSLLTADILGVLPDLVNDLLHDLSDVVKRRVSHAFATISDTHGRREWENALKEMEYYSNHDTSSSSTPASSSTQYASYRSRRGAQQQQQVSAPPGGSSSTMTNSPTAKVQKVVCEHLHTLFTSEMTAVCSKIYLLQRVLGLMKSRRKHSSDRVVEQEDTEKESIRTLLDEGIKILGESPTLLFWRTFSTSLETSLSRVPSSFFSHPLTNTTSQPLQRMTQSRIQYHPTWSSHLSQLVDYFFEKTSVWTNIESKSSTDKAPEEVFVRRSLGLS